MRERYDGTSGYSGHKFPDAFSEWIDENAMFDESSGDVESPQGWFARAGRNIFVHDSIGFVTRIRCNSVATAKRDFLVWCDSYAHWANDDDTEDVESVSCRLHPDHTHPEGSWSCEILSQENYYGTD